MQNGFWWWLVHSLWTVSRGWYGIKKKKGGGGRGARKIMCALLTSRARSLLRQGFKGPLEDTGSSRGSDALSYYLSLILKYSDAKWDTKIIDQNLEGKGGGMSVALPPGSATCFIHLKMVSQGWKSLLKQKEIVSVFDGLSARGCDHVLADKSSVKDQTYSREPVLIISPWCVSDWWSVSKI